MPGADNHDGAEYCVVLTTCASSDEAAKLCSSLLDQQLAACVQVVDVHSYYVWKGEPQSEPEKLLLIKTRRALYERVEAAIRAIHTYETPEIVCLPIVAGSSAYLGWIAAVTAAPAPTG